MTIFNHGSQGALIAYLKTHSIMVTILCGFVAMIPDLSHLFDKKGSWSIYEQFHFKLSSNERWDFTGISMAILICCIFTTPIPIFLLLIISYLLHITEDSWVHRPEGGWYSWTIYVEIFIWIVLFGVIVCLL